MTDFNPDYTPQQLIDMGVINQVYGDSPSLASLNKWPEHWLDKQDPLGWLQWYTKYSQGRKSPTDEKQIKRWKSFKARHGKQLQQNPTPRRAYALRNWAIDPTKLLENPKAKKQLLKAMKEYKEKKLNKQSSDIVYSSFLDEQETEPRYRFDAHLKNKNIAHLTTKPNEDHVWLDGLYVSKQHRNKGIAKELIQKAIEHYKNKELRLKARPYKDKPLNTKELQELYSKLGFLPQNKNIMIRPLNKQSAKLPDYSIDRPKGYKKTFQTIKGKIEKEYPVNYGYLTNYVNPDDSEELDVFIGSGGNNFGRFMKGNTLTGK